MYLQRTGRPGHELPLAKRGKGSNCLLWTVQHRASRLSYLVFCLSAVFGILSRFGEVRIERLQQRVLIAMPKLSLQGGIAGLVAAVLFQRSFETVFIALHIGHKGSEKGHWMPVFPFAASLARNFFGRKGFRHKGVFDEAFLDPAGGIGPAGCSRVCSRGFRHARSHAAVPGRRNRVPAHTLRAGAQTASPAAGPSSSPSLSPSS